MHTPKTRKLIALEVTQGLLPSVRPLILRIAQHDRELANQLQRALTSLALNLSEGSGSSLGNRRKHFSFALGSAREARTALHVAEAWSFIEHDAQVDATLDRIAALTYGLVKGAS